MCQECENEQVNASTKEFVISCERHKKQVGRKQGGMNVKNAQVNNLVLGGKDWSTFRYFYAES